MFLKYRATCFTMSVEPGSYAGVTQRSVLTSELYTTYNLNFPPLFSEQNGSVCPQVSLSSNFFFSVSLLCVTWFWVLCLFQSRYVHFTRVRKFHASLTLDDFFFNHITNFHKGCPMWLFKVLLPSLVFFICTPPVSWVSLILPATAAVKTCFTCKKIKTSDPP